MEALKSSIQRVPAHGLGPRTPAKSNVNSSSTAPQHFYVARRRLCDWITVAKDAASAARGCRCCHEDTQLSTVLFVDPLYSRGRLSVCQDKLLFCIHASALAYSKGWISDSEGGRSRLRRLPELGIVGAGGRCRNQRLATTFSNEEDLFCSKKF